MLDIDISLKPSKQFISLISIATFLSFFIISQLTVGIWLKFALFLFVAMYGGYIFWRYGLLMHSYSIGRIKSSNDEYYISNRISTYSVELLGDSTLTRWVSILRFKRLGHRTKHSCIVFNDSLDRDNYRSLIVRAKMR